jgi:E3 ubiquitin-protein ligase listerin
MLCWLCFLSFVDSAVANEARFRGSVSAYLDKARAVSSILDTVLPYLSIDKDRNNKRNIAYTAEDALDNPWFLDVTKLASLVVFRSVEAFPTHMKHWWDDDCPKALCLAVSQFVETKVAPETLRRELNRINKATNLGDMSVSGSTVSREVTATYIQDECQLSIVIQIPPTFPLRNVEVDGRRTLGIPEKKWKRWALNIRVMLNNQDGTLLDALMLWKENVDKEFGGLEPCPVCYSIISVKTHELPNLQCNTCSNCFHSSCLYKWFHSSGKSQCVLCQQPWSGTRIQKRA